MTIKIIDFITKHLIPLHIILIVMFSICWINDGYYTFRTIWLMLNDRYPWGFWGTIQFLLFTFFTFIAITCSREQYWKQLTTTIKYWLGLEALLNLCFITYNLPKDMWTAASVELAHIYALIDVLLILCMSNIIIKAFYEKQ